MKRSVMIVLALLVAVPVFGRVKMTNKKVVRELPKKLPRVQEPVYLNTFGADHRFGPAVQHSNRDSEWSAVLIDSSLNGYGPYNPTPNPLAHAMDEGYVAVYRQFQGLNVTAGYIGASQSEDGEEWFTEQTLNTRYPTGEEEPDLPTATGTAQGRYPSAGFAPGGNPTAIWNEYTNSDHGGGTYGGYPLYTYDSQGVGEFSTWVNPFHINNGCGTTPCDPMDLWNGNSWVNGGGGSPVLYTIYNGWSDTPANYYWIRSNFHANGYFIMNDPFIIASDGQTVDGGMTPLWYDYGNYTSRPDYHINPDGVGYMGQISYTYESDTEEPKLHTFWFKKTEDFGDSWTSDEGYQNSGYHYINDETIIRLSDSLYTLWSESPDDYPEQLWYPDAVCDSVDEATGDTIEVACGDSIFYSNVDGPCFLTPGWFFYYDFDVRTDNDGGLHFTVVAVPMVCPDSVGGCEDNDGDGLADTLYTESRFGSAGHYYFYNPDPVDQPNNWRASLLNDLSETYYADWGTSDIPHINSDAYPPMYYFYPQITLSEEEDSQVMWYAGYEGSAFTWSEDTMFYYPQDVDIYMMKSTDLGGSWTDLENVTSTPGGIYPDKHLEIGIHLASTGTDDEVSIFFQMPDFYTETYPPSTGYEDFMNRVYVGIYSNDAVGEGTVGNDVEQLGPTKFTLQQNYPNPFNPVTQIKYDLDRAGDVVLDLFDIRGAKVKTLVNEYHPAGSHQFTFDGSELASGVYFYSMTANGISKTRKLVLMK
mgnify:FL=1